MWCWRPRPRPGAGGWVAGWWEVQPEQDSGEGKDLQVTQFLHSFTGPSTTGNSTLTADTGHPHTSGTSHGQDSAPVDSVVHNHGHEDTTDAPRMTVKGNRKCPTLLKQKTQITGVSLLHSIPGSRQMTREQVNIGNVMVTAPLRAHTCAVLPPGACHTSTPLLPKAL